MIDKRENEKTVVHEVDRAELAQVDGGSDNVDIPPICGTHLPHPAPWLPRSQPSPWPW
jgi:hypothetical protein